MTEIPGFKLLSLEDRSLVQSYKEEMAISDMEFTQLYAWQETFLNQYKVINGYLCIIYRRNDNGYSCYAPLGRYEKERYNRTLMELGTILEKNGIPLRFDFVPENWRERFECLPGYQILMDYNDNFSDYIYKSEDFLNLKGKANERKRYLVNYFSSHYSYEYRSFTKEQTADVYQVVTAWCEGRSCKECYWGCEKHAIFRILNNWENFSCRGAVVYVSGSPKAFMAGELICQDMVVSHFQKADKRIKGLYAFISHEFYLREYPGIRFINLQEDIGILPLRQAKQSYRPCHLLRKYTITLTKNGEDK